jgi:hypothetical protein
LNLPSTVFMTYVDRFYQHYSVQKRNAERPHVAPFSVLSYPSSYVIQRAGLGRADVRMCSLNRLSRVLFVANFCRSEITDLNRSICADEHIVGLDIAMINAKLCRLCEKGNRLIHKGEDLSLRIVLLSLYIHCTLSEIFIHAAPLTILHNDTNLKPRIPRHQERCINFYNSWMIAKS